MHTHTHTHTQTHDTEEKIAKVTPVSMRNMSHKNMFQSFFTCVRQIVAECGSHV